MTGRAESFQGAAVFEPPFAVGRRFENRRSLMSLISIVSLFLLASCANRHFEVVAEGPPGDAPHSVEMLREARVATLHFPPGGYTFYAVDDLGYYYRAPQKIVEHTGGASVMHNGGVYLSKKTPKKLRGYVYMAGGLTHVGDLTRAHYEFRDDQ